MQKVARNLLTKAGMYFIFNMFFQFFTSYMSHALKEKSKSHALWNLIGGSIVSVGDRFPMD